MHLFGECGCSVSIKTAEKRAQHMRLVHGFTGDEVRLNNIILFVNLVIHLFVNFYVNLLEQINVYSV